MKGFATAPITGLLADPKVWPRHLQLARIDVNGTGSNGIARKKIMIVDDEKDISMVFKSGLERHGFSVETFNDPIEALSHFKPGYYDLLLLDVRMPRMSGFELFSEIMKRDKDAKIRLISAFEMHEHESNGYLPQGADRIIRKPISTKELAGIINKEMSQD